MRLTKPLHILTATALLMSCSYRSPEIIPCMCEHPDNTLGILPCMCGGESNKKDSKVIVKKTTRKASPRGVMGGDDGLQEERFAVRRRVSKRVAPQPHQNAQVLNRQYAKKVYYVDEEAQQAYNTLNHVRDDFASIRLAYVDFRLQNSQDSFNHNKLGNYRFRIFGCRRENKNVFLNEGRALERNMNFFDIFFHEMNEDFPVVVDKRDANFQLSDKIKTPEYLITAEITDYFMNICDEYDWDKNKQKKLRTGSSEMTVTWRVMDLCKKHVYWKGTTVGYGEITSGETNGETMLVERAFKEALNNLSYTPSFEKQMLKRVSPEKLMKQQRCWDRKQKDENSFQCRFKDDLLDLNHDYIEYDSPCLSSEYRKTDEYRRGYDYRAKLRDRCRHNRCNSNYEIIEEIPLEEDVYELDTSRDLYIDIDNREDLQLEEKSGFEAVGSAVEQRGGSDITSSSTNITETKIKCDDWVEVPLTKETSEITVENQEKSKTTDERVEEKSGFEAVGSAIEQRGGSEVTSSLTNITKTKAKDDYWVEVPLTQEASKVTVENREKTEKSMMMDKNKLCIMAQEPYQTRSPENIYRLRKAILGVENSQGEKGAGLLLSDQFILTSADLLVKDQNRFTVRLINKQTMNANAVRVNPNKNVALLLLDEKISSVRPLPLAKGLPAVKKGLFTTMGISDLESNIEGYLENKGQVTGYRYSPERGSEILVDTKVQNVTLGGALVDQKGNIVGIAHSGRNTDEGPDFFIPIESALEALDLSICGDLKKAKEDNVQEVKVVPEKEKITGIAQAIDTDKSDKAPKPMTGKEQK